MANTSWQKQSDKPLFEDILWSRPENKKNAGKLLIVGGHKLEFFSPLAAFDTAMKAGIGEAKVVMPDSVAKEILAAPQVLELKSAPSGGLSPLAITPLRAMVAEVDGVLFPGSLGKDSGTIQLIEKLLAKNDKPITFTADALDDLMSLGITSYDSELVHVVGELSQIRTLGTKLRSEKAITQDIQLTNLVNILSELTKRRKLTISTLVSNQILTATDGGVVTTKLDSTENWHINFAVNSAVLGIQFPEQKFEALATAGWISRS